VWTVRPQDMQGCALYFTVCCRQIPFPLSYFHTVALPKKHAGRQAASDSEVRVWPRHQKMPLAAWLTSFYARKLDQSLGAWEQINPSPARRGHLLSWGLNPSKDSIHVTAISRADNCTAMAPWHRNDMMHPPVCPSLGAGPFLRPPSLRSTLDVSIFSPLSLLLPGC